MNELIDLYEESFGTPGSLIELTSEEGTTFHVAVRFPDAELEITDTKIVSLGLSQLTDEDGLDIELTLTTHAKSSPELVEETGTFFYQLFEQIKEDGGFRSGTIYKTGAVPGFDGKDAVIILNAGYRSQEWLNEEDYKGELIKIVPLFSVEAEELEKIDIENRELFIYKSKVAFTDPQRKQTSIVYDAVYNTWQAISVWYTEHQVNNADVLTDMLAKSKSEEGAQLESALPTDLPEDFKQSFNIINDTVRIGRYYLHDSEKIIETHQYMTKMNDDGEFEEALDKLDTAPEFQPVWWHAQWVPIASDSYGDMILLDMAPAPEGTAGQVLRHSAVEGPAYTGNPSFLDWLDDYVTALRTGQYNIDDEGILTEA
ncbi:SMI1/KNR4 family protein [Chitinophaga rhizophila]|uniref:SMI1/KNR4 family protein n=1 Tax=Chitinophaga rhizophila TaxID=2866212 RepID=A0ABS7G5H9_9BACT|nr:SMI1/KNR4 family protein [Chitinophaga rhizophila]MBW8682909.1 SMI1/KNR4 family protein [Chitinophaga rhizophila]